MTQRTRYGWCCYTNIAARALCLALLVGLAGCREEIDRTYGQRKGDATDSVNGTAVLAGMFEQAGHTVFSWGALSPRLSERATAIVWFPNDFAAPTVEVRVWLEEWLEERPGRTLIYVGRDFDAAPLYWEKIKPLAPEDQRPEIARRQAAAENDFHVGRTALPADADAGWYGVQGKTPPRDVRSLAGAPDWTRGVDARKVEIELKGRFTPGDGAEVLLKSAGDALVTAENVGESRLIVVTNGSFLLNLPLVNHEHRKLAGQLVAEVGPPRQTVVFLESQAGGPPIRAEEPSVHVPTGMELFNIWPMSWVLLHLAVAGIIFCFARWPIFGRPHEPADNGVSDFGKHVEALGELFARTGDVPYAAARIAHYQQQAGTRRQAAEPPSPFAGQGAAAEPAEATGNRRRAALLKALIHQP